MRYYVCFSQIGSHITKYALYIQQHVYFQLLIFGIIVILFVLLVITFKIRKLVSSHCWNRFNVANAYNIYETIMVLVKFGRFVKLPLM